MWNTQIALASWVVTALLLAAALGVAWMRSRPATPPPAEVTGAPPAPDGVPAPADAGADIYAAECRSCHGAGEPRRRIPPLRGLAVELFVSEGGREYLIDFLLQGHVRSVENGEVTYSLSHPPYDHLSDAAGAAVLNYMLTSWGNDALLPREARLYTPADVAARRPRAP
jgi:mono/diheme cytochrome c family protein